MLRVLLVDDETDLVESLALALEGLCDVLTAKNGADALEVILRDDKIDAIVLDLMMPVMSGEEFRKAQLANETLSKIPVVVVSAHFDAPHIARRMKAVGCFMKPLDLEAFGVFVKKCVGER